MEKKNYHVITISGDSGEDSKQDARTLSEAIKFAKEWISDTYYDEVKIFRNGEIKRHYMRLRNGKVVNLLTIKYGDKRLQPTETPQISTQTAEVEEVSAGGEDTAERANLPQMYNLEYSTRQELSALPNIGKLARLGVFVRGVGYHTEYFRTVNGKAEELARVDNLPWDMERRDFPYQGSGVFGKTELFATWGEAVFATIEALTDYLRENAPTQPETPPAKGLSTDAEKSLRAQIKRQIQLLRNPFMFGNPEQLKTHHFPGLAKMVAGQRRQTPRQTNGCPHSAHW